MDVWVYVKEVLWPKNELAINTLAVQCIYIHIKVNLDS